MAHEEFVDPRLGTLLAERYRLDERLGAGGMGIVYRGVQLSDGTPVAVKFLHEGYASQPELVRRFKREVAVMNRVRHPSLVAILDSGVAAGGPYLVMELAKGRPLVELLDGTPMPPTRAVTIARRILAGVAQAHASGIVHRDLKPDNILVEDDGDEPRVKILDFGLAKVIESDDGTQLTGTGLALGTPSYMAPEQVSGGEIDARADIYALGVILYQMVVGKRPFVASAPIAILRMHLEDRPVPPREASPDVVISDRLEVAILRALEKAPSRRWQTAEAFDEALATTREGGSETDSRSAIQRRRGGGSWLMRGALLAAASGAAAFGWSRLPLRERDAIARTVQRVVDRAKGIEPPARTFLVPTKPPPRPTRAVSAGAPSIAGPTSHPAAPPAVAPVAHPATAQAAPAPIAPPPDATPRPATASPAAPGPAPAPSPSTVAATPAPPSPMPSPAPVAAAPTTVEAQAPTPVAPPPPVAPPTRAAAPASDPVAATEPSAPPRAPAPSTVPDDVDDDDEPAAPEPPRDTPGARLEAAAHEPAPKPAQKPAALPDAIRLVAAGKVDEALPILYRLKKQSPKRADVALWLGHAYFRKVWRTDALREYASALEWRPPLRKDPLLLRNVVVALDDPTYKPARAIVLKRLGASALPELRKAQHAARTPKAQARAARLVAELTRGKGKKRR